jgi:hypothetical protein
VSQGVSSVGIVFGRLISEYIGAIRKTFRDIFSWFSIGSLKRCGNTYCDSQNFLSNLPTEGHGEEPRFCAYLPDENDSENGSGDL